MTTIYIDTSAIFDANFFRSPYSQALLKACSLFEIKLAIPEIVFDETKGNFARQLQQKHNAFLRAERELSKLVDLETNTLPTSEIINAYEEWLEDLIAEYKIDVLPYPDLSLQDLVTTSYGARKPFKETGDGHKDFLVWTTIKNHILEHANKSENYFLTNNTKDFASKSKKDGWVLHPELAEEIEESLESLNIYTSIRSFFEKVLASRLTDLKLDDIPKLDRLEISEMTAKFLLEELPYQTYIGFEGVPFSNEVTISGVYEPNISDIQLTKVEESVIIKVTGAVDIEVSGYMDKFAFFHNEGRGTDITVDDEDWNDHVMAVSTTVQTDFEIDIFYAPATNEVSGYQITLPQEIEDDWFH